MKNTFSVFCARKIGRAQSIDTFLEAADRLRCFMNIKFFVEETGSMSSFYAQKAKEMNLENLIL